MTMNATKLENLLPKFVPISSAGIDATISRYIFSGLSHGSLRQH